jgi:catechol 2,3-dioxygenase-like lactoylglutathione lyase family enzyme
MKTTLAHIQINIAAENQAWYSDLFGFLGWSALWADETVAGFGTEAGASVWFASGATDAANDYDGRGMNHFGIGAESIADVDATVEYLKGKGVAALFETPRHRPEFSQSEEKTYYQVMFESPDRVLFEVVYTGPK